MGIFRVRVQRNGQIIQVGNWEIPTFEQNNISYSNINDYYESDHYAVGALAVSNIVSSFRQKMPIKLEKLSAGFKGFCMTGYDTTSAYTNYLVPSGITNITPITNALVGDKYIFDNGNYIEVTAVNNNWIVTVKYCLSNGNIAFSNVDFSANYTTGIVLPATIPWWTGNPNDVRLVRFNIGGSQNVYPQMLGNCNKIYSTPISVDYAIEFFTSIKPRDPNDPYADINNSEPSGNPDPSGVPENDSISIPSVPSVSVSDTGFITLFNPTLAQIKNLASYMWSSFFDVATFKKLFADPMDCILGLNLLPVPIPNGGVADVTVGNVSTGVSMTLAQTQWIEFDCGSLNIGTPYDNYLDYSPYTKYSIYLPYIGTVDLSADDCVGKTLSLKYHVDVLSCSCVAYLKCGDSVLYQFTGSCGYSIPITSENFRQMISNIVSIAGTVAGAVVTGGMSAPLAVGAMVNTANNVMNSKPSVHRSGSIGSSAGLMGIQRPYLILEFPNPCKPEQQYKYMGYPSFVTKAVGDLSGYTEFDTVILDKVVCDEDEKTLIYEILTGGVFL